ncbi:MAG: hypothetical protein PHN57_00360 [Candidatus Omnitrophica bacterium]|nr:hypothetical protein [Candidatus Omnitrophota bacterium]
MDKQRKQLIITGVLVLVLAVVWIRSLSSIKKKPNQKPAVSQPSLSAPAKAAAPAAAQTEGEKNKTELQAERLKLNWGRDPFSPAQTEKEQGAGELKLKGISFGRNKLGMAFINDEIVKKGDKIGEYEVMDIEKEKVLLKKGGQNFYLTFPDE